MKLIVVLVGVASTLRLGSFKAYKEATKVTAYTKLDTKLSLKETTSENNKSDQKIELVHKETKFKGNQKSKAKDTQRSKI